VQRPLRLRRSADFARLRTDGQTWRSPWLTLSIAPNQLPHNRYGFVIGSRVGGAVVRNRVRRQLRAVLLQVNEQLHPGYDLVWIARNEITGRAYTEISKAVYELVRRAHLLKSDE
jgi:ribonuclease P protein component